MSEQLVLFSVTPGPLSLTQSSFTLDTQVEPGTWTGTLAVTVADARGGESGWDLLVSIDGCDEWAISQVVHQSSAVGSAPGMKLNSSPGAFASGEQMTLMSKDTQVGPAGSTGGVWEVTVKLLVSTRDAAKLTPSVSLS